MLKCEGFAEIAHGTTGQMFAVSADELSWDVVASDERGMGPEFLHEAIIEHPVLGRLEWNVSEYPVGVLKNISLDIGDNKVVRDFSITIQSK